MTNLELEVLKLAMLETSMEKAAFKKEYRLSKAKLGGRKFKKLSELEEHVDFWDEGANVYWEQAFMRRRLKDTLGVKLAIRNYSRSLYNATHQTEPMLKMYYRENMQPENHKRQSNASQLGTSSQKVH